MKTITPIHRSIGGLTPVCRAFFQVATPSELGDLILTFDRRLRNPVNDFDMALNSSMKEIVRKVMLERVTIRGNAFWLSIWEKTDANEFGHILRMVNGSDRVEFRFPVKAPSRVNPAWMQYDDPKS